MTRYVARLSFNSSNWQRPTGDARRQEVGETYNQVNGFGHEDWLFRAGWLIDGWRYGFIQAVNHSYPRLSQSKEPFDLVLFTIDEKKRRRFVFSIESVECLAESAAEAAWSEFRRRGWYDAMRQDIQDVKGNVAALGNVRWAPNAINVRFRDANVMPFPDHSIAPKGDLTYSLNHYVLKDIDEAIAVADGNKKERGGRKTSYSISPYLRRGSAAVECTPEHELMKTRLLEALKAEFPMSEPICEQGYIDVRVQTSSDLFLFEIKSDLDARTAIRHALGQILEYAYHPRATIPKLDLHLVIVGRTPLSEEDRKYLNFLRSEFRLPLEYRVIPV